MAIKTVTIEPDETFAVWKILPGGTYFSDSTPHSICVGYETLYRHSYGSYEWTFTSEWKTGAGISGTVSVASAYLEFYYQTADNPYYMPQFEIVRTVTAATDALNDSTAWNLIDGATTILSTVTTARGDKKNLIRVGLDVTTDTQLQTSINTPGNYFLGIRRTDVTRDTRIEVGGASLVTGIGTGWGAATADEAAGPPRLVVTFTETDVSHPTQELRYTTSDPTTAQNTPSNSLGGYFASNEVFTTAQIGDFISSEQTTIDIESGGTLPTATGIAQIGPEIVSFTGVDTDNEQLTGVVRGVAPPSSFPSEVDQFPEYIRYLAVDDLFDKKPSAELVQYRCVGVAHTSSIALYSATVFLAQNNDANVQIDIGIEIPAFDATEGTFQSAVSSGSVTFDSESTTVRSQATGYYDGGHIVVDPGGDDFEAIIESYDDDGAKATFILDTAMSGFSLGTTFRINPAPAQTIINERTAPVTNSNRFFGFLGEVGSNQLDYCSLRENEGTLNQNDVFYLWVKRTLIQNKKSTNDTGAVVIIKGSVTGSPLTNINRGWWKFDQSLSDEVSTDDFVAGSGVTSTYQSFRQFNLLDNQLETQYGLLLGDSSTYSVDLSGTFTSASVYTLALSMRYYSPNAIGRTRHAITRETTPKIVPIIAKATTTVSGGEESITAGQGEWIISEIGYSKTENAIQLTICGDNNVPTDVYISEPYTPGFISVFIAVIYSKSSNYARIDINGKFGEQHTQLDDLQSPVSTVSYVHLNSVGFGYTDHETTGTTRYISDLVLRANGTTNSKQTVDVARFGPSTVLASGSENTRAIFLGVGYNQPETVTTTQIFGEGGNIFVARSNGEILEGFKPIWSNDYTFSDSNSVSRLTASETGVVEWTPEGARLQGTTIRI